MRKIYFIFAWKFGDIFWKTNIFNVLHFFTPTIQYSNFNRSDAVDDDYTLQDAELSNDSDVDDDYTLQDAGCSDDRMMMVMSIL